jgi:hypothetical protein
LFRSGERLRFDGGCRYEAKVSRAWGGVFRLWLELFSGLVEIDFLLSKPERLTASKRDQFHAKGGSIESDGSFDVGYREHQVVEMIDDKGHGL